MLGSENFWVGFLFSFKDFAKAFLLAREDSGKEFVLKELCEILDMGDPILC